MHPYKGDYDCDYGLPKLTERCTAIQQRKEMRAYRVQHLEFCKFKIPDRHLMSGCWTYLSISFWQNSPGMVRKINPSKIADDLWNDTIMWLQDAQGWVMEKWKEEITFGLVSA